MLGEARKNLTITELLLGDITRQSMLGGRRFNLITAFRFFANAESDLRSEAMGRLVDHLDEDGILVFNNHLLPSAMHLRVWRAWRRLRRQDEPAVHTMSLCEAISLAESSGLRIVSVHRVGFLHLPKVELPRWLMNTAEKLARGLRLDKRLFRDGDTHLQAGDLSS